MTKNSHHVAASNSHSQSTQASPGTLRFLYGGYAVLTLAAMILSWHRAPGALLGIGAIIIAFATIVSLLTYAVSKRQALPAMASLWAVLVISIATAILFLSSLFVGRPERGAVFVARLLNDTGLAVLPSVAANVVIGPDQKAFPNAFREAPSADGDKFEQAAVLSKGPSAIIKGATIEIDSPILYFNVLRLEDTTLETRGRAVTIEAVRIETVGNAAIKATIPASEVGKAGKSAGTVRLVIYERLSGRLNVDLQGGKGGRGADGKAGAKGANGGQGEHSSQGFMTCNHGGGKGGPGQPGGNGDDGSQGAGGGDGGDLIVQSTKSDQISQLIVFSAKGGEAGPGGVGGAAGPGGDGGPGGGGGGLCGGGPAGDPGPSGSPGKNGPPGSPGRDGNFIKLQL
ncbi:MULTISPECIES: hypothetical protein [unclassified Bradyrhizobium]|uniref:hypothetical protein n=1 Tax=unclassified Bradyrhizobium TaxID=2631580 RepID=UPI0028EE77CD|nr:MULTISPECIES: hypothetical protein [unclassified Bradyrhizobium]